jgi:CheY-like chemotaxis protein
MRKKQILILDCNGQNKPVICFNLEVAGFDIRVVTDEDEAINLLSHSRITEEHFSGLVVNNPYLNVDITKLVEDVRGIGVEIPVVFVKESQSLKQIVQALNIQYGQPRLYYAEPTSVVEMLSRLTEQDNSSNIISHAASLHR